MQYRDKPGNLPGPADQQRPRHEGGSPKIKKKMASRIVLSMIAIEKEQGYASSAAQPVTQPPLDLTLQKKGMLMCLFN